MGGRDCLLEDAIAPGFVLYVLDADPAVVLDAPTRAYLHERRAALVEVDEALDRAGTYRAWFETHGCAAALVRPDFYVFGTAATREDVPALVRRLEASLTNPSTSEERPAA
jgi:hypothetical protein